MSRYSNIEIQVDGSEDTDPDGTDPNGSSQPEVEQEADQAAAQTAELSLN